MSWPVLLGGAVVLTAGEVWLRNWLHSRRPELEDVVEPDGPTYTLDQVHGAVRWAELTTAARLESRAWGLVDDGSPFRDWDASLLHSLRTGEDVDVEALRAEASEQRRRADSLHERVLELMVERDGLRRHLALYQDWET